MLEEVKRNISIVCHPRGGIIRGLIIDSGNKDTYFQALRGLAIVAVVLIHSFNPALNGQESNVIIQILYRQYVNFAIPLFMFLAGYFVVKEKVLNLGSTNFVLKRMKRILIPYVVWSAFAVVLFVGLSPIALLVSLLTGTAVGPYYFIIALVQMIVLTPLIVKTLDNRFIRSLMIAITPLALLFYYIYTFIWNQTIGFPYYALPFFMWFIFYYFGILVRNTNLSSRVLLQKSVDSF